METVHEIILKPDLSRFCVCFCIEESAPLFSLLLTTVSVVLSSLATSVALLSVEVEILFSPLPIGSEQKSRDLLVQHHKALLNFPRSLAQVSRARMPRQKAQKRSPVKEQRILRATRVEIRLD